MSDFHQNGVITTFHDLGRRSTASLEEDLRGFAEKRPMSLILPALYSELERPALSRIVDELAEADWLSEIVIGLGDGPNDTALLDAVDLAVVVRGHGPAPGPLADDRPERVHRTTAPGPQGWTEGLTRFTTPSVRSHR